MVGEKLEWKMFILGVDSILVLIYTKERAMYRKDLLALTLGVLNSGDLSK